jgi:hypothetical protein
VGKGSLIANEYPALTSQIKETLLSDFNERKIVKTISLKKVAVVAVASLGFGLLSVVPAKADISLPVWVDTATTVNTVAITANTTTVQRTLNTQVNPAAVSAITAPAASSVVFTLKTGATFLTTNIIDMVLDGNVVASQTAGADTAAIALTARTLPSPSVQTTYNYVLRVYQTTGTRAAATTTVDVPVAITVVPASAFSVGRSTVYIADGANTATAATTLLGAEGSSTAGTQVANMRVTLKRGDDTDYASGTVYASMTGPGLLDMTAAVGTNDGDTATDVRSDSLASDADFNIAVTADGTSGVGTINLYIILADGVTKINLPSRTVTFYGSVATLEVVQTMSIAKSAGATTGYTGTTPGATDVAAVVITAKDSSGTTVCGVTGVTALSSDTSVIATSTITEDDGAGDGSVGKCKLIGQITTGSNATSGQTATLTYRHLVAGSSTVYLTAPVLTFKVASGTPKTVALSLDKTTYAPGEKATLTVTMKDSSGNAVSDGAHTDALATWVSSASVQGLPTATAPFTLNGVKTYTVYAPTSGGKFTINATLGTGVAAGATVTEASASVTDANAALLTQLDALNAKIVALNALIAKIMKRLNIR